MVKVKVLYEDASSASAPTEARTLAVRGSGSRLFDPGALEVRWRFYAYGKTANSGIVKLKEARRAFEEALAGLKGPKPMLRCGDIAEHNPERRKRWQIQEGAGKEIYLATFQPIRMAFPVTLTWPLSGRSLADRNRRADEIRGQLEELLARLGFDEDKSNSIDGWTTSEIRIEEGPVFSYVRRLSKEDLQSVFQLACQDARRCAVSCAAAFDQTLGAPLKLSSEFRKKVKRDYFYMGDTPPPYDDNTDHRRRSSTDLVSDRCEPLACTVSVEATYELKQ